MKIEEKVYKSKIELTAKNRIMKMDRQEIEKTFYMLKLASDEICRLNRMYQYDRDIVKLCNTPTFLKWIG